MPGEVLGIAGLPDSGRDELPRVLTDRARFASGGSLRLDPDVEWTDIGGLEGHLASRSFPLTGAGRASSGR